jgi:hypothetical protein
MILVIFGAGLWIMAEKHIQFNQALDITFATFVIMYGVIWIFRGADK